MEESKIQVTDKSNSRYLLLDFIRGIAVLNMIAYHTLWDLVFIYNINIPWYKGNIGFVWQQLICQSFILLSGFCVNLSRKGFKRGAVVFFCGLLISLVTYLFMRENIIVFGIMTFIGSAMIITEALKPVFKRIHSALGFAISLSLFVITYNLDRGYLGFKQFNIALPDFLYRNLFTTYLGFKEEGFFSTDYFPLFPWIFLFLTGYFIFGLTGGRERINKNNFLGLKPVNFLGRNALIIYLVHQPLIYLILNLICK